MDQQLILFLKEIMYRAGEIAIDKRKRGLIVNKKSDNSPVSNADIKISEFISHEIKRIGLDYPIICEEQENRQLMDSEYFWLIDPIDGTRSYIKNLDSFTVNIALIRNGSPVLGFILQPSLNRLHYTDINNNLIVEESGIQLLKTDKRSEDELIAVVSSNNFNKVTQRFIDEYDFSEIISVPSSIKLCLIADGTGDIYPKFGASMEWDIAAGHALINAAGGKVRDIAGSELSYGKNGFENPHFFAFNKRWMKQFS